MDFFNINSATEPLIQISKFHKSFLKYSLPIIHNFTYEQLINAVQQVIPYLYVENQYTQIINFLKLFTYYTVLVQKYEQDVIHILFEELLNSIPKNIFYHQVGNLVFNTT